MTFQGSWSYKSKKICQSATKCTPKTMMFDHIIIHLFAKNIENWGKTEYV